MGFWVKNAFEKYESETGYFLCHNLAADFYRDLHFYYYSSSVQPICNLCLACWIDFWYCDSCFLFSPCQRTGISSNPFYRTLLSHSSGFGVYLLKRAAQFNPYHRNNFSRNRNYFILNMKNLNKVLNRGEVKFILSVV